MGMFDSVMVKCPRCGGEVEFQSKAGECTLMRYTYEHVPAKIAHDIDGNVSECEGCGYSVEARVFERKIVQVVGL